MARHLLDRLIVYQVVNKSVSFCRARKLLAHSQEPATCPGREPDENILGP